MVCVRCGLCGTAVVLLRAPSQVYDMLKRHDGVLLAVWVALANQEEDYETARAAAVRAERASLRVATCVCVCVRECVWVCVWVGVGG